MKSQNILTIVITAFFVLCVPSLTFAGPETFHTMPGTRFQYMVTYAGGMPPPFVRDLISPADGIVTFFLDPQTNIVSLESTRTLANGRKAHTEIHADSSIPLSSLEPFEIPNFSVPGSTIDLTYTIELNAFLAAGNPFTVGQTFSVINGVTSLTDAIVFTDQFGNLFNGSATVEPFDQFGTVPEPTTILLFGTGLAGLTVKMRKRFQTRKHKQGSL
jgi:hypothetical protein